LLKQILNSIATVHMHTCRWDKKNILIKFVTYDWSKLFIKLFVICQIMKSKAVSKIFVIL
jgi:hypothetical protein